jgi:hypothetical protein
VSLLENLARNLSNIKALSNTNLKLFRQFYLTYPQISQTVPDQFALPFQKSQALPDELQTIGLILCATKNHTKVEYATAGLSNQLFVSKYKINLPSLEAIEEFIEEELGELQKDIKGIEQ